MIDGRDGLDGLSEQDDAFNSVQHAMLPSKVTQSVAAIAAHISHRLGAAAGTVLPGTVLPSPHTNPKRSIEQAMNGMAMLDGNFIADLHR